MHTTATTTVSIHLSTNLSENITYLKKLLPIGKSFDLVTRDLYFGQTKAFWIGINGFCKAELLQRVFSDLQNPSYTQDEDIRNLSCYVNSKIGYIQTTLCDTWDVLLQNLLSGPSVLLVDGFDRALLLDARTYPVRSIAEPDTERVTRGSRDGFVETLLFNANLIRRRVRSPGLTFEITQIGTASRTDLALAYVSDLVSPSYLRKIQKALQKLDVSSLTMGSKSLEELLVKKSWLHPLPSIQSTERPDVACSYLLEGHLLLLVDNSPAVLILPCTIFQFTQSPEDYYKSPSVGSYFRFVRFFCILASLLLMPVFLLLGAWFPEVVQKYNLLSTSNSGPMELIFYILVVEFILDLFKNSTSLNSSRFSGSLSIVGGLLIGDVAVRLNWASLEVFFYAAVTLLASLSLSSMEFADGLRIYRIFLLITTACFGLWGFLGGLFLVLLSAATTPTFGGLSYLWPLIPWNWQALKTLLFRFPTAKAQPDKVWKRD